METLFNILFSISAKIARILFYLFLFLTLSLHASEEPKNKKAFKHYQEVRALVGQTEFCMTQYNFLLYPYADSTIVIRLDTTLKGLEKRIIQLKKIKVYKKDKSLKETALSYFQSIQQYYLSKQKEIQFHYSDREKMSEIQRNYKTATESYDKAFYDACTAYNERYFPEWHPPKYRMMKHKMQRN